MMQLTAPAQLPSSVRSKRQVADALAWIQFLQRLKSQHKAEIARLEGELTAAISALAGYPTTVNQLAADCQASVQSYALKNKHLFPRGARTWTLGGLGHITLRDRPQAVAVCDESKRPDVAKAIADEIGLAASARELLAELRSSQTVAPIGKWLRVSAVLSMPNIADEHRAGRVLDEDLRRFGVEIDDQPTVTVEPE